jgi:capsule polysaccharide modification protein KpsS
MLNVSKEVVTINSTVGLEALLLGISTIVLDADAFYRPVGQFSRRTIEAYVDFLVKDVLWWSQEVQL